MICQEDMNDERELICGHKFCGGCIGRWLEEHSTCPVCRRDVGGNTRQTTERGIGVVSRMNEILTRLHDDIHRTNNELENTRLNFTRIMAGRVARNISGMRNYGNDPRVPSERVRIVVDMISEMELNEEERWYLIRQL